MIYRFEDACKLIGKSRSGGYLLVKAGELETFMDGRQRMVSRRALEAYAARKEKEALKEQRAAAA